MFRTDNRQAYNNLFQFLSKNVAPFSKEEANFCWDYYHKQNQMLDILQYLIDLSGEDNIQMGIGNLESPCMIIIDKLNDERFINFFRKICTTLHYHIFDFYITPFNKCSNVDLNTKAINAEIKDLNPKFIITFSQYIKNINFSNVYHIDINIYYKMLDMMDKEKDLKQEQLQELQQLKDIVWNTFQNINYGYNPITVKV